MAEQHATTRPAWMLAAASILAMAWLFAAWSQSASADCAADDPAGSTTTVRVIAACAEQDPWDSSRPEAS